MSDRPDPRAIYDATAMLPPPPHGGSVLSDGTLATMHAEAVDDPEAFGDFRLTVALRRRGVTRERTETLTQACGPLRWVALRMALQIAEEWST